VSAVAGVVMAVGTAAVFAKPQIGSTAHGGDPISLSGVDGQPLEFGSRRPAPQPLTPLPPSQTIQLVTFHEGGPSTAPMAGPPRRGGTRPHLDPACHPVRRQSLCRGELRPCLRGNAGASRLRRRDDGRAAPDAPGGPGGRRGTTRAIQDAVHQGWGIRFFSGELTPLQLRALLFGGAGAVITGMYGELPVDIRVQKSGFEGGHAVYVDSFRPPGPDGPAAYWVIDPIGHPWEGYKGAWWPATDVERFAGRRRRPDLHPVGLPGGTVPNEHPILPRDAYTGRGPGRVPWRQPVAG
jgi:hypothetical protein